MSIVSPELTSGDDAPAPTKRKRRSTSHLKLVPGDLKVRELIKAQAELYVQQLDRSRPFTRDELEGYGRDLLEKLELPEGYLGFAMVLIGNFYWKEQFLATPFDKRMLLLPHCLKHAEGCPAEYDEFGLDCERCGACSIADYKSTAEKLGYKVLVAEGTPIVLKLIVGGYVDSILGVACLNVLEKAIDKVLLAGVPSYAVPLHSGDCKNTKLDESWIWEVIDQYKPESAIKTSSYMPMMRAANDLFDQDFDRLVPKLRSGKGDSFSPLAQTEAIGLDFLAHGGKRFRPFVTLAAYDAMQKAQASEDQPALQAHEFSDSVRRTAIAIEAFHKASLVHDDIQDDDLYRYGRETLHRQHGLSAAINIGDYLIGLGYRLVTGGRKEIGADVAADIVDKFGDAHVKLCEGQGAELLWRDAKDKSLTPLDAMKIYALKTSPAFEAALYSGLRLAGPVEENEQAVTLFCRHVGVGFQILNDLKDWQGDDNNKLVAGQDALAMRPTLLLALALEGADDTQRTELKSMLGSGESTPENAARLRQIFESCGVFEKAERLVDKSRERAEAVADSVQPDELRQLLYFLVDTILEPEAPPQPAPLPLAAPGSLPIVSL